MGKGWLCKKKNVFHSNDNVTDDDDKEEKNIVKLTVNNIQKKKGNIQKQSIY